MKFNRTAIALLSAGAVIGTTAVIALQTHAQQNPAQVAPVTQTQTTQTPPVGGDKVTAQDTDNIQDPGGVEADAPKTTTQAVGTDAETNDDQGTAQVQDNGQDGETNDATQPTVTK